MNGRALVLLLLLAPLRADDTDLLKAVLNADARTPRVGTQRLEVFPGGSATVSVVEVARDSDGRARREHVSGPSAGLVVLTEEGWEWRREPGSTSWQRHLDLAAAESGLGADVGRILANYELTTRAGGTIAGRPTTLLALQPKREGNPARRLWVDDRTKLTLRCELVNRDGQLVGRTEYTKVDFRRPDPASVRLPADARKATGVVPGALQRVASPAELERRLGYEVLWPTQLPAGYRLAETFLRAAREGGWTPLTTYSDGVNTLTVMETRGRGQGRRNRRGWGWGRVQCTIESSRLQVVARLTIGGEEAVVVGDLEPRQLETMARSLKPGAPP